VKIILASSSVWRKQVMESLGLAFEVIESGLDEEPVKKSAKNPRELVLKLAWLKAEKVRRLIRNKNKPYLIIAADSVAYLKSGQNWRLFDKPKNRQQAKLMLTTLRGKKHHFITGLVAVDHQGRSLSDVCLSRVVLRNFSSEVLAKFLVSNGWQGKAGGYDVIHQQLVISYSGSYSNICGLPKEKLIPMLKKFGINVERKKGEMEVKKSK